MRNLILLSLSSLFLSSIFLLTGCGGSGANVIDPIEPPTQQYSNANLSGPYVLTASGSNFLGNEAIAAQFTADGHGRLTAGTLLTNTFGNGVKVMDTALTGTYNVNSDGRGDATFTLATGDSIKFQFVISASQISLIRFDNLGAATGAILKQDASISNVNGRFVCNLDGWLTINGQTYEQHSVGSLGFNNSEASTSQQIIRIAAGSPVTTSEDSIGSFALSANGIGTATMTGPNGTLELRLFFVSADRAIVLTDTEGELFSGIADRQTPSGDTGVNSVLNGNYIMSIQGVDQGSTLGRWTGIGRLTADGAGLIGGVRDTSGRTVEEVDSPLTGSYSMIADGHGTMTTSDGQQFQIFTISPDKVLIVGSAENTYTWGILQKQSPGPFSTGTVTGIFGLIMGGSSTYVSGTWNASGTGSLTGTVDVFNNASLATAQSITGTYQVDSTGRGTGTVVASAMGLGMNVTFYVISQNEIWMMATEPTLVAGRAFKQ